MNNKIKSSILLLSGAIFLFSNNLIGSEIRNAEARSVGSVVDEAILLIKDKYQIPGLAVGLTINGRNYIFNYGVASKAGNKPVTNTTLFEIGSISKTFTATLASLAEMRKQLSLTDKVSDHFDSLKDSKFGDVTLLHLGTHTAGGLPLQVPSDIGSEEQLIKYFNEWTPAYDQGRYRTYTNLGIGLLGVIAAKSMNKDFTTLMQQQIFPAFGLNSTYLTVPNARMLDYAQGYTKNDTPTRVSTGMLSVEAYGIKSTARDMIKFVDANMREGDVTRELQQAVMNTHIGYYKVGSMIQSLIWEQYQYSGDTNKVIEGSAARMVYGTMPVTKITSPTIQRADVLFQKTGSTNGFGAYIGFIPEKKIGIIILANKRYPNKDGVRTALRILSKFSPTTTVIKNASLPNCLVSKICEPFVLLDDSNRSAEVPMTLPQAFQWLSFPSVETIFA